MKRLIPIKAAICIPIPRIKSPKKSQITSFRFVLNAMFVNTSVPFVKHSPSICVEHSNLVNQIN